MCTSASSTITEYTLTAKSNQQILLFIALYNCDVDIKAAKQGGFITYSCGQRHAADLSTLTNNY
jgi:hypothetical protein